MSTSDQEQTHHLDLSYDSQPEFNAIDDESNYPYHKVYGHCVIVQSSLTP